MTPGEAEKLGRLVSEHHKAVQLTEIEERLRRMEEELGWCPALDEAASLALGVSASERAGPPALPPR